ncbi:MAG: hypothetical protein ABH878_09185 [bacterium]
MVKLLALKPGWALVLYVVLDFFCVGLGMGVPIFCILLGFPVGWFLARYVVKEPQEISAVLRRVLKYSALAAGITFVGMALLWGWCFVLLLDPNFDAANFGIPLILYEPRASLAGWLILMVVISPFLQFLMMLFGAVMGVVRGKG